MVSVMMITFYHLDLGRTVWIRDFSRFFFFSLQRLQKNKFRQKNLKYFQMQMHWWTDCFRQNQLSWSEQPSPRCSGNTQEPTQSCFFASLYSSRCSSWKIAICGLYLCVWAKRDALLRVRGAPSVTRRSVSTKQDHWNISLIGFAAKKLQTVNGERNTCWHFYCGHQ